MKKIFTIIFTVIWFLSLSVSSIRAQSATPLAQTPVTIIGDSLSIGATPYFQQLFPQIIPNINAVQGRAWDDGATALENIIAQGQLQKVIIFEQGTNNLGVTQEEVDRVLKDTAGNHVIFVTVYDGSDPSRAATTNPILENAQTQHPDQVSIADWNSLVSQHLDWLSGDPSLVHPNDAGYQAYANLIAQTVATQASVSTATPTSPTASGNSEPQAGNFETDSNTVTLNIGTPPVSSSGGAVLQWAQVVNNAEEIGAGGRYDRMVTDISNNGYSATKATGAIDQGIGPNGIYWCTYLVIDSYNLSGIEGLSTALHAAVVGMIGFWKITPGYTYFDYYSNHNVLSKVEPGYAIFFQETPGATTLGKLDHTAIVKSIKLNSHGDGTIETLDANADPPKDNTYPVSGWTIQIDWLSNVVGFGTNQQNQPTQSTTNNTNSSINNLFANLPGTSTATAVIDGQITSKDGDKQMPSYSVIKLWVAAAIFNASNNGSLNLSDSYTVTNNDIASGTGILNTESLPVTLTYKQLVEDMIEYSDNTATNILINKLGGFSAVNNYISSNGYMNTKIQRYLGSLDSTNDNYTSASDAITFMKNLYNNNIVNSSYSNQLIQILETRKQKENPTYVYLGRNLPANADYVEKSGVGPNVRNDVGSFLDSAGKRVFLAIFLSDLSDQTGGETALANAAKQIYDRGQ